MERVAKAGVLMVMLKRGLWTLFVAADDMGCSLFRTHRPFCKTMCVAEAFSDRKKIMVSASSGGSRRLQPGRGRAKLGHSAGGRLAEVAQRRRGACHRGRDGVEHECDTERSGAGRRARPHGSDRRGR